MSSINAVQGSYYSLVYDAATAGGVRIDSEAAQYKAQVDTVSFSERSLALAQDVAAMRDAAAQQLSASERYAAALAFGSDYCSASGHNEWNSTLINTGQQSTSFTVTSKEGTVVGISSVNIVDMERGNTLSVFEDSILTIQITRADGFQLNLALTEDMRVNDLEDGGISVYFVQSGITKIYNAQGNENVIEGESAIGTTGDDLIINLNSTLVESDDGDDIIVNLADDAVLLGGKGQDTIIVPYVAYRQTIDGGDGDDTVVGSVFHGSTIILDQGDTLTANTIRTSNLEMG